VRRVIISAFVLVLIVSSGWLSYTTYTLWNDPSTLPIERVQVEGTFRYISRKSIEEQVLPFVQNGFLHVDVAALRMQLLKNQAVKEVRIIRVWPNKIGIDVIEHHFLAQWKEASTQRIGMISEEGIVVEIAPNETDRSLPLLISPPGQIKPLLHTMQQINEKLETINLALTQLTVDQRHALKVTLNNDVTLFLGRESTINRTERFIQIYEKLIPKISGKINYIDLRYTNGIAVKIDN